LVEIFSKFRDAVPQIPQIPILILQGTADSILEPGGAKILYQSLKSNNKELKFFKNADHSLFMDSNSQKIYGIIQVWIEKLL